MKNYFNRLLCVVFFTFIYSGIKAQDSPQVEPNGKLKIMVVGAHPDDPETTMGGTICKYTAAGHEVVVVYFTAGEAGIEGVAHNEAAKIRKAEAEKSCQIMNSRPVFFGQIDGSCVITPQWYDEMAKLLETEKPDIIFTHWPIDSHRDHRICSNLVYDAWLYAGQKQPLYFFEACTGNQTQNFQPDTWILRQLFSKNGRPVLFTKARGWKSFT